MPLLLLIEKYSQKIPLYLMEIYKYNLPVKTFHDGT